MPDLGFPQPFVVRPAKPEDAAFVIACWLEQWWKESQWAHRVRAREYFAGHRPLVISILERAHALVACDANDPDALVGFIVYEPDYPGGPVVDLAYVKKAFRGMGVGRALLAATGLPQNLAGVRLTHCTRAWFSTKTGGPGLEERFPAAVHDPYLAWRYAPRPTEERA